ncbi:MAG: SUMF1/EgtB/PvdO family nonheme iron enzyme [Chloroflexota bacterium]
MKLFVSYRSTDSSKVDPIVHRLRSLGYSIWQDKDSIPAGQDWWEAICEGIVTSDVFLFMVSEESVKSFACLAELSYAHELNLPIIPFVIEGEWIYNAGGKYDIAFWDDIPDELHDTRAQFLFYEGVSFVEKLKIGIETLLAKQMPRLPASPPPDPRKASDATNTPTVIYDEAYDFAYRGELDHAKKLFRKLVRHNDPIFGAIALEWVHMIDEYTRLKQMAIRKSTRRIARGQWTIYIEKFPVDFLDGIFDPANVAQMLTNEVSSTKSTAKISVSKEQIAKVTTPSKPTSKDLMPDPFDWIEIPNQGFSIAKYPITNAQFAKFVDAKGYVNERWWTKEGWQKCQEGWNYDSGWKASGISWTEPRYWRSRRWNDDMQPVVGVSLHEAMAFCIWLNELVNENILLPTEDQWQYAAQSDDGRTYPWGNDWNNKWCNNNIDKNGFGKTTPVTQYEGEGDSPYGVVDMAGNVWEWCLIDYKNQNINKRSSVVRGGSWNSFDFNQFRCDFGELWYPHFWNSYSLGFRISRFS